MIRILHRVNSIKMLEDTSTDFGVEVDIRSNNDKLILHHDPFKKGELFENWLKHFQHRTLILNVKEEGLEEYIIDLMKQYKVDDFFFLDQSFPFLLKTTNLGEHRCAIRVSEYESIETTLSLAGQVHWIWVDCFTHFPLSSEDSIKLKKNGFKLCIVSPELQGRDADKEIPILLNKLKKLDINPEAVCTKYPELWKGFMD